MPGRFEAVDEGQPFAVLVDYAHTPGLARERPAHGARPRTGPRDLRLRLRRRPRPRQAAADGPDRRRARRRRDRHLRQSAQRGARGDHRRDRSRAPTGAEVEPDRREAIARAIGEAARRRRRRDRRQGPRAGPGVRRRARSRSTTARSRARRCAGSERRRDPAPPRRAARSLGRARRAHGPTRSPACRSTRAASSAGDLFVAVGRGRRVPRTTRSSAAPRRRSCPDEPFAAFAALGSARPRPLGRARRRRSPARPARRRRRTSSPRSALPHARTVAAEASFNNEIGVPLTLCRLEPDTEICILELAMRGFGQIAELCAIARPDVGVITNVGPVHLELVGVARGRRAGEGRAASRRCRPGGTAIVPDELPGRARRHRRRPPRRGRRRVESRRTGARTSLERRRASTSPREHHARTRAAALAALDALGLPLPGAGRGRVLALARRGAAAAGRRPAHQRRLQREPGLDARGARAPRGDARRPPPRGGPRRHGRARRRRARATTRRSAAKRRGTASTCCSRSASWRAGYVDGGVPVTSWAPDAEAAAAEARRARPAGRRRPRQGLARARARARRRGARGGERLSRVLLAGVVAMLISILAGPKFIEFLRRKELGQHIREEGPAAPRRQAGHADDGRPADPVRGRDRRSSRFSTLHACRR